MFSSCDFDGKHLKVRTPSLVTHLTKACVPHCVTTEREKAKSVGHEKNEGWFTFFIYMCCFLILHSLLQRVSLPDFLCFITTSSTFGVCVCYERGRWPKHRRMSEALQRQEGTEDVLNILTSVTETNKMSVEKRLRISSKWQSAQCLKTFVCYIMRGTSFKLLWNLRDVKQ